MKIGLIGSNNNLIENNLRKEIIKRNYELVDSNDLEMEILFYVIQNSDINKVIKKANSLNIRNLIIITEDRKLSIEGSFNYKIWILNFFNILGGKNNDIIEWSKLKDDFRFSDSEYKSYIYISDVINAIFYIWLSSGSKINIYDIIQEDKTKLNDILDWINKKSIKYDDEKMYNYNFKFDILRKMGLEIRLNSDDAVKKVINNLKENKK